MNPIKKVYCRTFQTALYMALPFLPYRIPKIIDHVNSLPEILKKEGCCHPLIVTDRGIRMHGLTAGLEYTLTQKNISFIVYDNTVSNPTTQNVEEALKIFIEEDCDCLIAIGGGSSIDCAKAIGARFVKPQQSLSQMKGILKVHRKLPLLIAVPTTAGTGSEATLAAVIVDSDTRHKYAINDFPLIPRYAVLDPELTLTLPPFLTATTGLDALTHAVEAYIGNSVTRETRRQALRAVKLIFENLDEAYQNGNNKRARKRMLYASFYSGCAFTRSYVGYVHAVAHSLGGAYNVPHGLANAVVLPYVLEAYGSKIYKKLQDLAIVAGLADHTMSSKEAAHLFIQSIKNMNKRYGIGETIPELKLEDIPKLCKYADHEANPLYPVPVLMNAKELEKFYLDVLE